MDSLPLVEIFLKELFDKIRYRDIASRPRDKNLEALAELDITPIKRVEYLSMSYPLKNK